MLIKVKVQGSKRSDVLAAMKHRRNVPQGMSDLDFAAQEIREYMELRLAQYYTHLAQTAAAPSPSGIVTATADDAE
jgi:hypothetical protein